MQSSTVLACICGEFSASRGDYFMRHADSSIVCAECGECMQLIEKTPYFQEVDSDTYISGVRVKVLSYAPTYGELPELVGRR